MRVRICGPLSRGARMSPKGPVLIFKDLLSRLRLLVRQSDSTNWQSVSGLAPNPVQDLVVAIAHDPDLRLGRARAFGVDQILHEGRAHRHEEPVEVVPPEG